MSRLWMGFACGIGIVAAMDPASAYDEVCGLIDAPNACTFAVVCHCVEGSCSNRHVPLQVKRHFVSGDGYVIGTTWSPCFQEWTCVPIAGLTCMGYDNCKPGIIMLGEYSIETLIYDDPPVPCEGDPVG